MEPVLCPGPEYTISSYFQFLIAQHARKYSSFAQDQAATDTLEPRPSTWLCTHRLTFRLYRPKHTLFKSLRSQSLAFNMTSDGGRNDNIRQLRPRCYRCQRCCLSEHCPLSESDRVASPGVSRYTLRKKPVVRLYFHSKADTCANAAVPARDDGRREPRSTTHVDLRGKKERRVTRAQKRELGVIQE